MLKWTENRASATLLVSYSQLLWAALVKTPYLTPWLRLGGATMGITVLALLAGVLTGAIWGVWSRAMMGTVSAAFRSLRASLTSVVPPGMWLLIDCLDQWGTFRDF
jgi:hypothetical protein